MGFFSEFKSDQDAAGAVQDAAENAESVDLDSMLSRVDEAQPQEAEAQPQEAAQEDEFMIKLTQALNNEQAPGATEAPVPEEPVFEEAPAVQEEQAAPAVPEFAPAAAPQPQFEQEGGFTMDMDMQGTQTVTDENAMITSGMVVNGDVSTTGNLELMGRVSGNVHANGKLTISGEILGDSTAAEVYAESARITGEVRSQGSVKIGQSTIVIGNIYANGAVVAGAVKGDIDVHGPVILDTTAIVMGNIKSQSVQINNGAVIEGMCSQVYAEVNPSAFFENLKG